MKCHTILKDVGRMKQRLAKFLKGPFSKTDDKDNALNVHKQVEESLLPQLCVAGGLHLFLLKG